MPTTLFDKLWDSHVAADLGGGWCLLHVDRHLLHDLSGTAGLTDLAARGLPVHSPGLTFATPDHAVSTAHGRDELTDGTGALLRRSLRCRGRRTASCIPGRRLPMARARVQHVRRRQWRTCARRRAMRLHIEPQLRRPSRPGRPHPPCQPRHGRRRSVARLHHRPALAVTMQPLCEVWGQAVVLPQPNVDTDVIIRIERLMEVRVNPAARSQLGRWAFEAIRYTPDGTLRIECPFNDPARQGAPILIAGPNFGCGSSREGAVWALASVGIRCVIAESFGDIFHANCFQNGMLPIVLPGQDVATLAGPAQAGATLHVDLQDQTVTVPGSPAIHFTIDPGRRTGLLLGLDEVGQSLLHAEAIAQWQSQDQAQRPWAWGGRA